MRAKTKKKREKELNERDSHEYFFIGVALEFRRPIQAFVPCLLHDGRSGLGLCFIQCDDAIEIDLAVQARLDGWRQVVGVVVTIVVIATATVMMVIVMVRHVECLGGKVDSWC